MCRNAAARTPGRCRPSGPLGSLNLAAPRARLEGLLEPRARQQHVGADREPERVIAHKRYLDEHGNDRKDHQQERDHKPEVHCAYLLALRRSAKTLLKLIAGNVRDVVASSRATSEIRSLTSMLHHSQCTCALDCGPRVEDCGAFCPGRPPQAIARRP